MMYAGVHIKAPVAGIAMGLVKTGEEYAILIDILGMEDALGDVDFFFFQAEDGIRAGHVTGVQTCALPILTLLSGVASISPSQMGRVGGKIIGYYLVTSAVAIIIGMGLALLIRPGLGLDMPGGGEEPEESPALTDVILNIFPENMFEAMVEGNVLAVIFVAVIAGLALGWMLHGDNERLRVLAQPVKDLSDAGTEIMFLIVRGVLEYGPIGVFALIAVVVGETGTDSLLPMLELTGTVYAGVAIMILAYAVLLLLFKVDLRQFFGAAKDPMLTAYVTRSSSGTLPVTMRAADKLGIKEGIHGFSLPLGATINMDGTALYVGVSTLRGRLK